MSQYLVLLIMIETLIWYKVHETGFLEPEIIQWNWLEKYFFAQSMISLWYSLPQDMVMATKLGCFKEGLGSSEALHACIASIMVMAITADLASLVLGSKLSAWVSGTQQNGDPKNVLEFFCSYREILSLLKQIWHWVLYKAWWCFYQIMKNHNL